MDRLHRILTARPSGGARDEVQWATRHRVLVLLLAAHLPVLVILALVAGGEPLRDVLLVVPLALALLVGGRAAGRTVASLAVTVGLVVATSLLVHLSGGQPWSYFHSFAILGFIGLYRDWRLFLVVIGWVVAQHGLIMTGVVTGGPGAAQDPGLFGALHVAFVALAALGMLMLCRATEREHEQAVAERLEEAELLKTELIGVVSHEFRTPLTAILGFAHTVARHYDELDREAMRLCTEAIERQARRLTRLVQNLMATSGDIGLGSASRDIAPIIRTLTTDLAEGRALQRLVVDVPDSLRAEISHDAASLIVGNLVDNALKFAVDDTTVFVRGYTENDEIVFEVSNTTHDLGAGQIERLFAAFVQGDSSETRPRDGLGLGLHVVRRIVSAHGGQVEARQEGAQIRFTVRLRAATDHHRASVP